MPLQLETYKSAKKGLKFHKSSLILVNLAFLSSIKCDLQCSLIYFYFYFQQNPPLFPKNKASDTAWHPTTLTS